MAKIDKGLWPLTFKTITREPYIRDKQSVLFSDSLQPEDDMFLMFYLIACNTYLIKVDWKVASELTSYISFASILYLCGLFSSKFVYVQKPVTIQ